MTFPKHSFHNKSVFITVHPAMSQEDNMRTLTVLVSLLGVVTALSNHATCKIGKTSITAFNNKRSKLEGLDAWHVLMDFTHADKKVSCFARRWEMVISKGSLNIEVGKGLGYATVNGKRMVLARGKPVFLKNNDGADIARLDGDNSWVNVTDLENNFSWVYKKNLITIWATPPIKGNTKGLCGSIN